MTCTLNCSSGITYTYSPKISVRVGFKASRNDHFQTTIKFSLTASHGLIEISMACPVSFILWVIVVGVRYGPTTGTIILVKYIGIGYSRITVTPLCLIWTNPKTASGGGTISIRARLETATCWHQWLPLPSIMSSSRTRL